MSFGVSLDGTIYVAEAGAEGSISVGITTPESCPQSQLWYSGEIHECEGTGTLIGFHCDPTTPLVSVKYYENLSPCPTIPTLGDVIDSISWEDLEDLANGNGTLLFPCNALADATSSLDPSAQERKSATISRCSDDPPGTLLQPAPTVTTYGTGAASTSVLAHVPTDQLSQIETSIPDSPDASLRVVIDNPGAFLPFLAEPTPEDLPVQLATARGALPDLDWIDGLSVTIDDVYPEAGYSYQRLVHASLRGTGDFMFEIPESVSAGSEPATIWLHRWTRIYGDIFRTELSNSVGELLPRKNGASSVAVSTHIDFAPTLVNWVNRPFELLGGDSVRYQVVESDPISDSCTIELRVDRDASIDGSPSLSAFFGDYWAYRVDQVSTTPTIVSRSRYGSSGDLRERISYGSYQEVATGIERPLRLLVERFDDAGQVRHLTRLTILGHRRDDATPEQIQAPIPTSDLWTVRLR
jgi:hypothetical protein